jgi:hypothetical protein
VLENRRGILSSKCKQERQTQQNTNPRPHVNVSSLPARPIFRLFHIALKRCLNRLAKDLLPLSNR